MTPTNSITALSIEKRNELESLMMAFEQGWTPNLIKDYGDQIESDLDESFRRVAISELVKIDLERRWSIGQGRMLEEYVREFPRLGSTETLEPELILIEFTARKSRDANMQLESYSDRYPHQYEDLVRLATQSLDSVPGSTVKPAQASIETSRIGNIQETKAPTKPVDVGVPVEFGRYRILRELGAGAMGTVHLAHDIQLDRQVALKTPSFQAENEAEMVTRFYREARAAAKIQHRNICPIYDVGEIDGQHFITMAFIKGRTMSDLIQPDKLPPPKTSAVLVHRLALALAEAHRHNVIHRDLKPANIMIDKKREPVVMDFGLARQTDVESRMTQSGMLLGTPAYMSPEQLSGNSDDVGKQSDIYALGVILYELLTGKLPFNGTLAQVVCQILQEEPKPPSQIREQVSLELEAICAKMMAKSRDERYQSMDEVASAIKDHITGPKEKQAQGNPASSNRSQSTSRPNSGESVSETGVLNEFFAAQAASDPLQTSMESLPSRSPIPMAVPVSQPIAPAKTPVQIRPARPEPAAGTGFFKGNVKWIAAGLAGVFLVAAVMGIVFFVNTRYGTIRIETFGDLDGLEVVVDGSTVSLTDSKRAKASGHDLELKLGGAHLKFDPETNQFIITENGTEKRLTVSVQDVQLASSSFTVTRNKETVLKFELLPNDEKLETSDPKLADQTIKNSVPSANAPEPEYISLFNGRDLAGWVGHGLNEKTGDTVWQWKDGELVGKTPRKGTEYNTFLASEKKYRDFEIEFETKLEGSKANSGLQIRSRLFNERLFRVDGPQVDIGPGYWGGLYGEGDGGVMKASDPELVKRAIRPNDYNKFHVRCVGQRVTINVNGTTLVDDEFPSMAQEGILAWQLHKGKTPMTVRFRNVRILEVDTETEANRIGNEADVGRGLESDREISDPNSSGKVADATALVSPQTVFTSPVDEATGYALSPVSALNASSPTSIARRVAERVKLRGGLTDIRFVEKGGGARIKPNMAIPDEPFHVTRIEIRKRHSITPDDMELFAQIQGPFRMNLFQSGVSDTALAHFENSPHLTQLVIRDKGGVKDRGLGSISTLPNLRLLELGCPKITDQGFRSLASLTKLSELFLNSPRLTDEILKTIRGFENLRTLHLTGAMIDDEDLAGLSGLHKLQFLSLEKSKVRGPGLVHLKELPDLKILFLSGTKLMDNGLSAVAGLSRLESLNLSLSNVRDDDIKSLVELRSLDTLYLADTGVTDEGLKTLGTMSRLSSLFLNNTNVTDDGIAHLTGLRQMQVLYLNNTQVSDASVEYLKQLSKLKSLYLNKTKVSAKGIAELKKAIPKCNVNVTAISQITIENQ